MANLRELTFGTRVSEPGYGLSGEIVGFGKAKAGEPGPVVKVRFDDGFENWYRPSAIIVSKPAPQ